MVEKSVNNFTYVIIAESDAVWSYKSTDDKKKVFAIQDELRVETGLPIARVKVWIVPVDGNGKKDMSKKKRVRKGDM